MDRRAQRGHGLRDHAGAAAVRRPRPAAPAAAGRGRARCRSAPSRSPPPSHDLALSTLDDGVAVLEPHHQRADHDPRRRARSTTDAAAGRAGLAARRAPTARSVPVTVPDARHVYVVADDRRRRATSRCPATAPSCSRRWPGRASSTSPTSRPARCTCSTRAGQRSRRASTFKSAGRPAGARGPRELPVHQRARTRRPPGWSTTRTGCAIVDKYADDVLGGDPPPTPPDPPPPPKPKKPPVSKPGAPRNVRAAAGNAEARVSWQAGRRERRGDHPVRGRGRGQDVPGRRRPAVAAT